MSANVRPRRLVHKGSVMASGYVLADDTRAHAEVLKVWCPGHELWHWPARLVWRLPVPERAVCEEAVGLALVAEGHRLVSAPLAPDELELLSGDVVTVEGGQAVCRPLAERADPSRWLDVSTFSLEQVEPLGEPPSRVALALELRASDARSALGFAPLDPEAQAVLERMRGGARPEVEARPPITIGPIARGLISGLRGVARFFGRLLARRPRTSEGAGGPAQPPVRRTPGWLARLDAWLDRALDVSRLTGFLGRRQAEYFARLMRMFEEGDLDAALRHAVPLGGQGEPNGRSLALPSPRDSLELSLRARGGAGGAITLQANYYEELRRRYRAAAERLEREGRYAEAAFVLAELLQADEEAVALLERHGKHQLAAELAEARQLAPGLQVRQWFLAGNVDRAVAVARRHGAFADAIARLERTQNVASANKLRLLWADTFATSGDFYNAVLTAWPLENTRPLLRRWLELGIADGGVAAARLKVKRLTLAGDEPDAAELLQELEGDDAEHAAARQVIAADLENEGGRIDPQVLKALAKEAYRASLRDAAVLPTPRATRLLELSADGALRADQVVPLEPPERLIQRTSPVTFEVEARDRGALAVSDAALLPDGKMLLALGEVGARLVTRDGRTAAHFDVPAERLVMWDGGGRALALAWRGEAVLIARLDLGARKVERLAPMPLATWADGTDGSLWFVHDGDALLGLDLHDAKLRALWRVPRMPPLLSPPARSLTSLAVINGGVELWRYELPALTLRARQAMQPGLLERATVLADGTVWAAHGGQAWHQAQAQRFITGLGGAPVSDVRGAGAWISVVTHGVRVGWMLADTRAAVVRFSASLPDAKVHVRVQADAAVYSDDEGRVLAVDLLSGRVTRNLRIR